MALNQHLQIPNQCMTLTIQRKNIGEKLDENPNLPQSPNNPV